MLSCFSLFSPHLVFLKDELDRSLALHVIGKVALAWSLLGFAKYFDP